MVSSGVERRTRYRETRRGKMVPGEGEEQLAERMNATICGVTCVEAFLGCRSAYVAASLSIGKIELDSGDSRGNPSAYIEYCPIRLGRRMSQHAIAAVAMILRRELFAALVETT
jgi:hypothetical protein